MKLLGLTEPYRAPAPTPVPQPDPEPIAPDSPNAPSDPLPSYEDQPPVNPVASRWARPALREGAVCGPGAITRSVA